MAFGTGSTFAALKILIGDGESTEVFAPLCGVTQKNISYSSDTVETKMPDCTNEDLPSFKEYGVEAIGIAISCSGKWTVQAHGTIIDWWKGAAPKNIKVQYVDAASGDIEFVNGPAILANLTHDVAKGNKIDGSFELMFSSAPTFVVAS